ncbi:MAG: hypothetical protein HS108_09245 [Planctomycetes bacterium]|jgi:hypothetical protein|nr:hypothetical protein [Planctomycetota bacterium]MCL4729056.1 hypothetical protein [Planctomycetota bacterium]
MKTAGIAMLLLTLACPAAVLAARGQDWFSLRLEPPLRSRLLPLDRELAGQLLDESGPRSKDQMFGAGAALGFAGDPIGFGLSGWFDFYFTTWLAAGARFQMDYGAITRRHEDGGTGLDFSLQFGAKFVFDLEDWEWSRWCRPFVALYPAGFRYHSATERAKDSQGRRFDFAYSDVFYVISVGGGVDFFLTSNIALGAGILLDGTVGGSRHKKRGVKIRHVGGADFFFEYARLSVRF